MERGIIIAIDYMKQHFALPTEFADRRPIRDESPEGRDAGADGRRGGGLGERGGFGFGRGRGRGADRYDKAALTTFLGKEYLCKIYRS